MKTRPHAEVLWLETPNSECSQIRLHTSCVRKNHPYYAISQLLITKSLSIKEWLFYTSKCLSGLLCSSSNFLVYKDSSNFLLYRERRNIASFLVTIIHPDIVSGNTRGARYYGRKHSHISEVSSGSFLVSVVILLVSSNSWTDTYYCIMCDESKHHDDICHESMWS